MSLDSKDPARRLAKQLSCPTCSHRPESFFADGTVCPTCGRKKSLFLEALGMSSIMHNIQQADDEVAFIKRQLTALEKDHDSLHLENVNLRAKVEELTQERDGLRDIHEATIKRIGEMCGQDLSDEPRAKWALLAVGRVVDDLAASQAREQQLREALEGALYNCIGERFDNYRKLLSAPHDNRALLNACKLYAAEAIKNAVKKWVGFGYWQAHPMATQIEMVRADNMLAEAEQLRKEAE